LKLGEKMIKRLAKRLVPAPVYLAILSHIRRGVRPVRWGNLRRTKPVSALFGFDRGQPIDRYYIEAFLQNHRSDIHGMVLEIGDPEYTIKFGCDRVTRANVLHAVPGNSQATLVGNLETGQGLPSEAYDCMILTQTFPFIYNVQAAITTCYTCLKPNGVLLATFPGISQISRYDMDRWGDYWRLTDNSARRLFGDVFGEKNMVVEVYGNVLTACAFLLGLAATELKPEELDTRDPNYQVTITVRAQKPG
jgi:hypothetical protein